jgi:23S rRNA pseudouridine2605 synthase
MAKERKADEGSDQRLQKALAAAGLGSRRQCEDLIREGRVEVDRRVVTELGTRVNPARQEIRVDGESLRSSKRLYFAVNKPVGVVSTNRDPSGRPRVIDLVPTEQRVFAVGRLDRSSDGLILVTNDGEFANRITHPRYGVEKTYLVRVAGAPDQRKLARLKKGVHLAEGFARAQSIIVKKKHGHSTDLIIVLNEGRNREIRRILARVGHKVLTLKRIAVGPVKLGDLPVGGWRRLMPAEVEKLLLAAKEKRRAVKKRTQPALAPSASEGNAGHQSADDQYLQKQALLAEPLSLDDLLRDDLDEGPMDVSTTDARTSRESADFSEPRGGVIDYEHSPAAAPRGPRHKHQKKWRQKGGHRHREAQGELEHLPRESFGKKRGGKRVFSPLEHGRGAAGEKAGNFRFRPKRQKRKKHNAKSYGTDNQRRGERRQQKPQQQFGKQGGKRKGRR